MNRAPVRRCPLDVGPLHFCTIRPATLQPGFDRLSRRGLPLQGPYLVRTRQCAFCQTGLREQGVEDQSPHKAGEDPARSRHDGVKRRRAYIVERVARGSANGGRHRHLSISRCWEVGFKAHQRGSSSRIYAPTGELQTPSSSGTVKTAFPTRKPGQCAANCPLILIVLCPSFLLEASNPQSLLVKVVKHRRGASAQMPTLGADSHGRFADAWPVGTPQARLHPTALLAYWAEAIQFVLRSAVGHLCKLSSCAVL